MKINVGSKNEIKVSAVREAVSGYSSLSRAQISAVEAPSKISEQPKSLEETIRGAINRAKGAFQNCDISFGIESGMMQVPYTKTGYMDFCACVIYDGNECHIGLSAAFEFPREVTRLILEEGLDANQAFYKLGLTSNQKIGSAEGATGMLTKGRVTRKDYTKQAIAMALIHLENSDLFKPY